MKNGLILEGGAMRGLWSAGVTDVMMEAGVRPDGIIGVSAGAAFGCNYKSRQPGRAIRYNKRFARDKRYSGLGSLLRTGDYFNARFAYHTVPTDYDVFDGEAFADNPMAFWLVATDIETGQAVCKQLTQVDHDALEWIRASCAMPVVSTVVELEGHKLLDGGIADSIPLERFEQMGYSRNVVVLTQPRGYRKRPSRWQPLIGWSLRRHPAVVRAMAQRHLMYNSELDFVAQAEREGRCLVVRPDEPIPIGHISHDPQEMEHVYQLGRQVGQRYLGRIQAFYHES